MLGAFYSIMSLLRLVKSLVNKTVSFLNLYYFNGQCIVCTRGVQVLYVTIVRLQKSLNLWRSHHWAAIVSRILSSTVQSFPSQPAEKPPMNYKMVFFIKFTFYSHFEHEIRR